MAYLPWSTTTSSAGIEKVRLCPSRRFCDWHWRAKATTGQSPGPRRWTWRTSPRNMRRSTVAANRFDPGAGVGSQAPKEGKAGNLGDSSSLATEHPSLPNLPDIPIEVCGCLSLTIGVSPRGWFSRVSSRVMGLVICDLPSSRIGEPCERISSSRARAVPDRPRGSDTPWRLRARLGSVVRFAAVGGEMVRVILTPREIRATRRSLAR
ncbi:hypothetical protein SAMN05444166_2958 [Singulisphaera sp. GP187]|nr:hypothetical protein SAMN05444166_2958 [Singulisphaera sp. GP187]